MPFQSRDESLKLLVSYFEMLVNQNGKKCKERLE